jgi:hypothetical protein
MSHKRANIFALLTQMTAHMQVGMFGKHLNQCPKTIQPGFSRWFANGGGSYMVSVLQVQ